VNVPKNDPFFQHTEHRPLTQSWFNFFATLAGRKPLEVLSGTRAARANYEASRYADGSLYFETDTTLYYRVIDGEWTYASGTMRNTWANRPTGLTALDNELRFYATDRTILYRADAGALKYESGTTRDVYANFLSGLGANDAGTLYFATDYVRMWRWTGSAWVYADGERPQKEITWYPGSVPTGWALCDGSGVTVTTSAAGTTSFTTPNLVGKYLKGGTYSGSVVPAVAPGITGSTTDPAGGHSHTGSTAGGTTGTPSASAINQVAGAGNVSATNLHTHSIPSLSLTTSTEPDHTHDLNGLTVDDTGEPIHVLMLPIVKI
jgi:hypothetical protein